LLKPRIDLARYIATLPGEYCIGPGNREAFDRFNNALSATAGTIDRGNSIFEKHFSSLVGQAQPLLQNVEHEANQITPTSKDFWPVVVATDHYNEFIKLFNLDIWNLTVRLEALIVQFRQALNNASAAAERALNQIQTNVEVEAQAFLNEGKNCKAAHRHWDEVDGFEGCGRYRNTLDRVIRVMIPNFNLFRAPATQRVRNATQLPQTAINQMEGNFKSFPNLKWLPPPSDAFPHHRYGDEKRKFGGDTVIAALNNIANAFHGRTRRELGVGDMQYEHGGRISGHKSHKDGINADVDDYSSEVIPKIMTP
jgi:hypothetical protein